MPQVVLSCGRCLWQVGVILPGGSRLSPTLRLCKSCPAFWGYFNVKSTICTPGKSSLTLHDTRDPENKVTGIRADHLQELIVLGIIIVQEDTLVFHASSQFKGMNCLLELIIYDVFVDWCGTTSAHRKLSKLTRVHGQSAMYTWISFHVALQTGNPISFDRVNKWREQLRSLQEPMGKRKKIGSAGEG